MDNSKTMPKIACINCQHYENHYCKHHDTPACPFARCDEFKWKPVVWKKNDIGVR